MWNYIEPWIDKRQYAFVSFSILIGLWLSYSAITTQRVSSPSDLITIDGTLSSYSFVDGRKGTKRYYIWLIEYETPFQIPADFLSSFDKEKFEEVIKKGKRLYIGISINDTSSLIKSKGRIRIYDLRSDNISFLKSSLTIKQENNTLQYLIGPLFMIAGICYYFYRHRKLRNEYR